MGDHAEEEKALTSLAELCRDGMEEEWEFNEWAHGKTGRPMGKAYQAWSAASYIAAYLRYQGDHKIEVAEEGPDELTQSAESGLAPVVIDQDLDLDKGGSAQVDAAKLEGGRTEEH